MPGDDPDSPPDEQRSYQQRRFDAFADLVDRAAGAPDLPLARGIKPNLNVQCVRETLESGSLPGRGAYGSLLSPETVRRLACDATVTRTVLSASSQVLDQGRAARTWNIHQWRAAVATFGGCAFPTSEGRACGRPPAWCDLHHVHWWRHGGPTDLANGVPLCSFHHHRVHDDGWNMAYDHTTATVTVTRTSDGHDLRRSVTFTALANSPAAGAPDGVTAPAAGLQRLPL